MTISPRSEHRQRSTVWPQVARPRRRRHLRRAARRRAALGAGSGLSGRLGLGLRRGRPRRARARSRLRFGRRAASPGSAAGAVGAAVVGRRWRQRWAPRPVFARHSRATAGASRRGPGARLPVGATKRASSTWSRSPPTPRRSGSMAARRRAAACQAGRIGGVSVRTRPRDGSDALDHLVEDDADVPTPVLELV